MAIRQRFRRTGSAPVGSGSQWPGYRSPGSPSHGDGGQVDVDLVVSVGTDHHPFDRLVDWVDEWCDSHPDAAVVVQRGRSRPSRHGDCRELVPHGELCDLFRRASVVITHGGPSTVMDARAQGRLPIVVARDPELGEHVDGHQLRFVEHLGEKGLAEVAATRDELFELIDRAMADPSAFVVTAEAGVAEGVRRFAGVVDDILNGSGSGPGSVPGSGGGPGASGGAPPSRPAVSRTR